MRRTKRNVYLVIPHNGIVKFIHHMMDHAQTCQPLRIPWINCDDLFILEFGFLKVSNNNACIFVNPLCV